MKPKNCQVAVYYFPNWHPSTWNTSILVLPNHMGVKESEWTALQKARPRFPGHQQPKVPLWGYEDESDPAVMAKKIDAAADHGVDAFLFDWYWWENGPSLQACLEQGYLKAENNQRVKFAIMWANHRPVTRAAYDRAVDQIVNEYFNHPSYWKMDGKPYLSIYELYTLLKGFETEEDACRAVESLREKTLKAGFPGLHLNLVEWGLRNLPDPSYENQRRWLARLGVESVTDYVWIHHVALSKFPENDYREVAEAAYADWDRFAAEYPLPYHPNVSMGWDSWPRVPVERPFEPGEYPATPLMTGNPPLEFRKALTRARAWLERPEVTQKILTINAWNEWTEGSYLEPDTIHGMGYLEAIRDVFAE